MVMTMIVSITITMMHDEQWMANHDDDDHHHRHDRDHDIDIDIADDLDDSRMDAQQVKSGLDAGSGVEGMACSMMMWNVQRD